MALQFCNVSADFTLVTRVLKTNKLHTQKSVNSTSTGNKTGRASLWLLLDDRPGHRTQVLGLARRLNVLAQDKHLAFNFANHIPNAVLRANLWSLKTGASTQLAPPYPDLVIGMGRRIVPVARWIKQQSGGSTRVVLLGRKAVNGTNVCDLGIVCAHFGLLPSPDMVELIVPPTQVDAIALETVRLDTKNPMKKLAAPHVVFLLGGPTAQHQLTPGFAAKMVADIARASRDLGGALAIVTSRRTPKNVVAALKQAAPDAHIHEWRAERVDNPYLSYLAHADLLVVTGESESMIAEAVATTRPLTIYPLAASAKKFKHGLASAIRARAVAQGFLARLCYWVMSHGWIAAPRDLGIMHKLIENNGLGEVFTGCLNETVPRQHHEIDELAVRIASLVQEQR